MTSGHAHLHANLRQENVDPLILSYWGDPEQLVYIEKTRDFEEKDFNFLYPRESSNAVSFINESADNIWKFEEDEYFYRACFELEFKNIKLAEVLEINKSFYWKLITFRIPKLSQKSRVATLLPKYNDKDPNTGRDIKIMTFDDAKKHWQKHEGFFKHDAVKGIMLKVDAVINSKISESGYIFTPLINR